MRNIIIISIAVAALLIYGIEPARTVAEDGTAVSAAGQLELCECEVIMGLEMCECVPQE